MMAGMSSPIRALADEYWEAVLRASPTYATFLGDRRFDTEIEDASVTRSEQPRLPVRFASGEVSVLDIDGLTALVQFDP